MSRSLLLARLIVAISGSALAPTQLPWLTTEDGAHTLTVAAIDHAGNSVVLGRLVTVDNTPPETEISPSSIGPCE